MVKLNKTALQKKLAEIEKQKGTNVYTNSQIKKLRGMYWSTGIEDLDNLLGGGIQEGSIIELYGAEGSGKTSLLYHLLSLHEYGVIMPCEGRYDAERSEFFGNTDDNLIIYKNSGSGEDYINKIISFSKVGVPIIGVDSVPHLIPKEDYEKVIKGVENDKVYAQKIAGTPMLLKVTLPQIRDNIVLSGTTVVFINQLRDTIGAMPFAEQTHTPGGWALRHQCDLRIKLARKEWIKIPNHNPSNSAAKETIGQIIKLKLEKNIISSPMQECELVLFYERGFVSHANKKEVEKEIEAEHKVKYKNNKIASDSWDDWEDEE